MKQRYEVIVDMHKKFDATLLRLSLIGMMVKVIKVIKLTPNPKRREMKKYQIIYADPPWRYSDQGCQGTMANHYKGMKLQDICNLPIQDICTNNSILFLWATYPMLKEALRVIESWGFIYKSIAFQWIKLNPKSKSPFYGLGRWTRGNTEPCLLATRGNPKRISASVFQLIQEPRQQHSKKPDIVRNKIIQLMGDLPRIELFARERTKGWSAWGNEVDSDIILPPNNHNHPKGEGDDRRRK